MKISLLNLKRQYKYLKEDIEKNLENIISEYSIIEMKFYFSKKEE